MLGEDHSLRQEFPKYIEQIEQLIKSDSNFAEKVAKYDAVDKEIRELELANAPIDDGAMHQLKHDRAELKDSLYRVLVSA